ncbi:MAG: putative cysteine proteinase [Streblomastix strix]|uniref:Putative cysteine proteinase n=1 Tax=Streblomastix strix TaxID=222440 RepID=A0A5J4VE56_9EUKA|nr:MAG: putative cysteine proteinase [Streblomastix strix]
MKTQIIDAIQIEKLVQIEMEKVAKQQEEQERLRQNEINKQEEQERLRQNEINKQEEEKRKIADEEERQELLRIQREQEELNKKEQEEADERLRNEQEEQKRMRQAREARIKMQEIEDKKRLQAEERRRQQQLEEEKRKIADEEQNKQMKRTLMKQTKAKFIITNRQAAILDRSSNFHGQTFPQWNDALHSIKVQQQQDPLFTSPVEYPRYIIHNVVTMTRPKDVYDFTQDNIVMFKKKNGDQNILSQNDSWNSVQQGIIGDCCFICSLIQMKMMEQKINKPLLSDKIYPRGPDNIGIYNPYGKYHIRLFINGCYRMIEIDDLLPCFGGIQTARSAETGELWVTLMEKAYLRCVGNGYDSHELDFSEAAFAFSGWLPDHFFKLNLIWEKEYEWKKFMRRFKSKNIIVEVGIPTDIFPDQRNDNLGLVSNHGYAVMDVIECGKTKLLQIRNPHRTAVWRGKYSAWDKQNWTPQLQEAAKFTPVNSEDECQKDGTFFMQLEDFKQYFDHGTISWNPDLLPYRQEIHFAWKEKHYSQSNTNLHEYFAPQFLLYRKQKEQKIWLVLNRHYQTKISPHNNAPTGNEEDRYQQENVYMNMDFFKHSNPQVFEYKRAGGRYVGRMIGSTYMNVYSSLFQIGLFDEDIHQTSLNDEGLTEEQKQKARIHEFTKDYVGYFTIAIGIHNLLVRTHGDLNFSLFAYSDQELNPIQKIKIHHEDDVEFDTHWDPVPMFEFNSGITRRDVSITIKGIKQNKKLSIQNSVGITAGERSWQQNGNGEQLIQKLLFVLGGKNAADAFYSVARFILGTQIDLVMTPRQISSKYGKEIDINAFWENEGGIHISEVDNALDEPQPNIGMGGVAKFPLFEDQLIQTKLSQRTYQLQDQNNDGKQEIAVKKRVLRVSAICRPKFFGRRDAFSLESNGPEGYDVKIIQRHLPCQFCSYELAWTDFIKSKPGINFATGPRSKLFYIIKTDKATDIHIQIIIQQQTNAKLCPYAEFQVVKLSGPKLVNETAITVRLSGATDRGMWENDDEILFSADQSTSFEKLYPQLYSNADNSKKDGWVLSHQGSGRLDADDTYYGLCVSARQFVADSLTVVSFAWSNSPLKLYKIE